MINPIPTNNIIGESNATSRFSGASWFNEASQHNILLVGVGGIGSWVALLISRLQPHRFTLLDFDTVDSINLAGQFFSANEIGNLKIMAIKRQVESFSRYFGVDAVEEQFDSTSAVYDVTICGLDNMTTREMVYRRWKERVLSYPESERKQCLLIDGRLAAETLQVFCLRGDAPYYWDIYAKDWLFNDAEADSTVCSYKQTSYCANMIASIITNLYINWCANLAGTEIIDRSLPFMVQYDADQMYFKTIE